MLLSEFRSLTEHLPGELEFLTAGAETKLLFRNEDSLSVDSETQDQILGLSRCSGDWDRVSNKTGANRKALEMSLHDQNERERVERWLWKVAKASGKVVRVLQDPDFPSQATIQTEISESREGEIKKYLAELEEVHSRISSHLTEFLR